MSFSKSEVTLLYPSLWPFITEYVATAGFKSLCTLCLHDIIVKQTPAAGARRRGGGGNALCSVFSDFTRKVARRKWGAQTNICGNGSKRDEDYFTAHIFLVKSGSQKVMQIFLMRFFDRARSNSIGNGSERDEN